MAEFELGKFPPNISIVPATHCAWLRRPELGRNVWEKPNGELYTHYNSAVPIVALRRPSKPQDL
jgi:hypothetical protein